MSPIRPLQPTFASGEISPSIYSRVDINKYQSSLKTCRNFIIHPTGGASNRPGTRFVATAKYDDRTSIVQEFVFNQDQKYVFEIGDEYIRFFTSGAQINVEAGDIASWNSGTAYEVGDYVTYNGATVYYSIQNGTNKQPDTQTAFWTPQTIYEIPTPYADTDVELLRFETSADTIFITHPDFQTRVLQRFGDVDWRMSLYEPEDGPFMIENIDDSHSLHVSAVTGSVTLTSTLDLFATGHVGALFKLNHYIGGQKVTTAFTSATSGTSIKCFTTWRIITHGTWTGSINVEKSNDNGATWVVLRSFSSANDFNANTSGTEDEEINPVPFLVRINATVLSSGTCNADLTTDPFTQEGIVKITAVSTTKIATATVLQDVGTTLNTASWHEGSWSDYRGWPAVSRFFQDRLCFAGTYTEPQTLWFTVTGQYFTFQVHQTLLATDSISTPIPSRQVNIINGLVAFKRLLVFTSASIWSIGPVSGSGMAPGAFTTEIEEYNGSNGINPVVIGNEAIYIQEHGKIVSNIGFQFANDSFTGADSNILAMHLFDFWEIEDIAYQRNPDRIVWMKRSDGWLIGMTYMRDQEVVAFHQHNTGQATGDKFQSLCVIPADGFDEVWFTVERANGWFIERMVLRMEAYSCNGELEITSLNQLFMDSSVSFNEPLDIEDITVDDDGNVFVTRTAHGFSTDDVITINCVEGMDEVNNRKFKILEAGDEVVALHLEMEGTDEATTFVDSSTFNHGVVVANTTYGTIVTDTANPAVGLASGRFENKNGNDAGARVLIHMESGFTDASENGRTVTVTTPTISATNPFPFGAGCGLFGVNDFLSCGSDASWRFGIGDGALDFWCVVTTEGKIVTNAKVDGTEIGWYVEAAGGLIKFNYTLDGTNVVTSAVTIPFTVGVALHVAFNRYGTSFYGFKNGVLQGTEDWTGVNIYASFNVLRIGKSYGTGFSGKLKEMRVGIGARWRESFPTRTYPYGPAQGLGFTADGSALEINNHTAFNLGANNFSLEFRVKFWDSLINTTLAENPVMINKGNVNDTEISFIIQFVSVSAATGNLVFRYSSTGSTASTTAFNHAITVTDFSNTTWTKIKYRRDGTSLYLEINDIVVETFNISTNAIFNSTRKLRVGSRYINSQSALFDGPSAWIDEVILRTGSGDPDSFQLIDLGGDPINGTGYSEYISGGVIRQAFDGFDGLDHLEDQTVAILGDGEALDQQVVDDGEISLTLSSAAYVSVGLPYDSDFGTLNVEIGLPDGTLQGKKSLYSNVSFRLLNTRGGFIGPDEDHLYEAFTTENLARATPIAPVIGSGDNRLFNVDIRQPLGAGYKGGSQIFYRQSDPLPVSILMVVPEVTVPNSSVSNKR